MYLLLGSPADPCCAGVKAALEADGRPVRIVPSPLTHPTRFSWWFNSWRCASQLVWEGEPPLAAEEIAGVLVRTQGWLEPQGWQPDDLAYAQAETQAALLGWWWSLECPVV